MTPRMDDHDAAPARLSFLADARHNPAAIRRIYGPRSPRYRRQLRLDRAVADAPCCRAAAAPWSAWRIPWPSGHRPAPPVRSGAARLVAALSHDPGVADNADEGPG